MTAKANYIISAQDATRDAIRSIQNNFKSLDQGVKSTARNMNLALGFLAGAGLKNLFRNALDAAAEASGAGSDFAKTLADVKKSAQSLMVPKEGLPSVTESLHELADTLKDPAIVSSADAIFSSIIKGGTAAVKVLAETAAGLRILATGKGGNAAVDIDNKVLGLKDQLLGLDSDPRNSVARAARAQIQRQINELQIQYDTARHGDAGLGLQKIDSSQAMANLDALIIEPFEAKQKAAKDAADELMNTQKELSEASEKLYGVTSDAASDQFKEIIDQQQHAVEAQRQLTEEAEKSQKEQEQRTAEWRDKMVEENKRAAQESADAWGEMFLTAMDDGFDGLLRSWKRTLKMMVAEAAGSGILSFLKGGSFGSGFAGSLDKAFTGLGHLFGFASGGSILPGGAGGTDSQVVAFRKSPSERVDIYTPGKQGGGSLTVNIDARGATEDGAKRLERYIPAIIQQAAQQAHVMTLNSFSRA